MAGRLAARMGLSKAEGKDAVDSVFAAIGEALAQEEDVTGLSQADPTPARSALPPGATLAICRRARRESNG